MIVWFDEEAPREVIGDKGFNLCRLSRADLPIPQGFSVTADSIKTLTVRDMEGLLLRLKAPAVAVRSSAIEEDSARASFAGIHKTRLNVRTAVDVIGALRAIEAAAGSPTANEYRKTRRLTSTTSFVAIVQSFVRADLAGILFTRDPVDGADRVIIEGSWGLGQSVVDGRVTPDRWMLSRDESVISVTVSDKDIAVVPDADGVKEIEVDALRRSIPCLTSAQAATLFDVGRTCERVLGQPQDVEWAIVGEDVWILQSRPITTF